MSVPYGNPTAPADEAVAVTPSDSTIFTTATRGLYVGVTGDVTVDMAKTGSAIVFKAVPAGTLLPIAVTKVRNATTASQIVALY